MWEENWRPHIAFPHHRRLCKEQGKLYSFKQITVVLLQCEYRLVLRSWVKTKKWNETHSSRNRATILRTFGEEQFPKFDHGIGCKDINDKRKPRLTLSLSSPWTSQSFASLFVLWLHLSYLVLLFVTIRLLRHTNSYINQPLPTFANLC